MKNKPIIYGLFLVFLCMCASADVTINQSSVSITQYIGTSATYSLRLTNTDQNLSESVNVQITGGEILDLTNDFPKTLTIPAAASRDLLFTINIPLTKTAHTVTGYLSFYYTGQQNIPISVNMQSATTTTTTITTTTTTPQTTTTTTTTTTIPQPNQNTLKFLSSLYSNSFLQGLVTTEDFYIKNYGNCDIDIIGVQYDGTTIFPPAVRRPIRQSGTLVSTLAPGERSKVTVTIDTVGLILGNYRPTFWIIGEDCNGYQVRDSLSFSIDVVQGIQTNESNDENELQLILYNYETSGTMRAVVKANSNKIENAKVKLYYPDGDYNTEYSDEDGESKFEIETAGDYKIVASKSGYTNAEKQFTLTVGSSDLAINLLNEPIFQDILQVQVVAGTKNISGATVKVIYPDGNYENIVASTDGKISVLLTKTGAYTLLASKSGYTSGMKNFNVVMKPFDITITGTQAINEVLTFTAVSNGSNVANVIIIVKKPDASEVTLITSSSGTATFTLPTTGTFNIRANKTGYVEFSKDIVVESKGLTITAEGNLLAGSNVVIKTMSGSTVIGTVSLEITLPDNTIVTQSTSDAGSLSYKFEKVGTYKITATKTGFAQAIQTFDIKKPTMTIVQTFYDLTNQVVSSATCGGKIVVSIKGIGETYVLDATTQMTPPSGVIRTITTAETLSEDGSYILTATHKDFDTATASFSVSCPAILTIAPKNINKGEIMYAKFSKTIADAMLTCGNKPAAYLSVDSTGVVQQRVDDVGDCILSWNGGKNSTPFKVSGGLIDLSALGGLKDIFLAAIILGAFIFIIFAIRRGMGGNLLSKKEEGKALFGPGGYT